MRYLFKQAFVIKKLIVNLTLLYKSAFDGIRLCIERQKPAGTTHTFIKSLLYLCVFASKLIS